MQYIIIPDEFHLLYQIGQIGFIISIIIFLIFLHPRSQSSEVARTYAIGSVLTFQIGGFGLPIIVILSYETVYSWTSPIGVIGGYALIILALTQHWFDRKKRTIEIDGSSEVPSSL